MVVTEEAAVRGEALRAQLAGAGVELFTADKHGKQAGREAEGQRYYSLVAMLPHVMEADRAEETAAAETLIQLAS